MPASNDPELVRKHYLTDQSLRIRQEIHNTYTVPKIDYPAWVIDNLQWRGDELVLDVGGGAGAYYDVLMQRVPDATYVGLDLSPGMLAQHPARSSVVNADAMQLPFANDSVDVVMANHMMYHLPDIDAAIEEFRRVLRPDGALLVATNSAQSMPELQVLMRRAILLLTRSVGTQVRPPAPASDLFALENGARKLSHHFYAVVRYDLPSKLVFPDVEPLMRYLNSTRSLREPQLPSDVNWDDVMMIMEQQATHLVNHLGELSINKLAGTLLATDRGDFINEFVGIQEQAV